MDNKERLRLHEHFEKNPEEYVIWNPYSLYFGMDPLDVVIITSLQHQTPEHKKSLDEWLKNHGFETE